MFAALAATAAYVYYVSIVSEKFQLKCSRRIGRSSEVEIAVSNCTIAVWKSTQRRLRRRRRWKKKDTKANETTTIQNGISSRCWCFESEKFKAELQRALWTSGKADRQWVRCWYKYRLVAMLCRVLRIDLRYSSFSRTRSLYTHILQSVAHRQNFCRFACARPIAFGLNDSNTMRTFGFAFDELHTHLCKRASKLSQLLLPHGVLFLPSALTTHQPTCSSVCKFTAQNYTLTGDSSGCLHGHHFHHYRYYCDCCCASLHTAKAGASECK